MRPAALLALLFENLIEGLPTGFRSLGFRADAGCYKGSLRLPQFSHEGASSVLCPITYISRLLCTGCSAAICLAQRPVNYWTGDCPSMWLGPKKEGLTPNSKPNKPVEVGF